MDFPGTDKILSISEVRKNLASLLREVAAGKGPVSIAQDSHVEVSLISRRDWIGLRERLEILEDLAETYEILNDTDLMRRLRESEKNIRRGRGYSLNRSRRMMGL